MANLLFHIFIVSLITVSQSKHVHQFEQQEQQKLPQENPFGENDPLLWADPDSQFASLCPNVTSCLCYESADDIRADCYDAELDSIPTDLPWNITILTISRTLISAIPSNAFSYYDLLKELVIYENPIYTVEINALNGLSKLSKLDLHSNNMTSLPLNLFSDCPALVEIDLHDNKLSDVPTIPNLPQLMKLNYAENKLTTISADYFNNADNLLEIDLSENELNSLPQNAFLGLTSLETLLLSNNKLPSLPSAVFSPLLSVSFMDISDNLLTTIEADQFAGPGTSLISLYLSHNRISSIHQSAFAGLDELDLLQLDYNELTDVPQALSELPKLDYLWLSANPFETIKERAFEGIVELNEVFLSDMPSLLSVHVDAFQGNKELQQIALMKNPNLTEFGPEHLPDEDHPLLRLLYLSDNGFEFMDEALFGGKSRLVRVDLQGNPFHCDCAIQWLSQVVQDDVVWARHWVEAGTAPRCARPQHLEDFKISAMLPHDLSCDDANITALTENPVVAYLHGNATLQVKLQNGLPASRWITPDGVEHKPLRRPPGTQENQFVLSQKPTVTEHYTDDHDVIATLEYSNATGAAGLHRVIATNGNGEQEQEVTLEVLPYVLTLPPPTAGRANQNHLPRYGWSLILTLMAVRVAFVA